MRDALLADPRNIRSQQFGDPQPPNRLVRWSNRLQNRWERYRARIDQFLVIVHACPRRSDTPRRLDSTAVSGVPVRMPRTAASSAKAAICTHGAMSLIAAIVDTKRRVFDLSFYRFDASFQLIGPANAERKAAIGVEELDTVAASYCLRTLDTGLKASVVRHEVKVVCAAAMRLNGGHRN